MQPYPSNIPPGARWEPNFSSNEYLWVSGDLLEGKRHGLNRKYRNDGSLCVEMSYNQGVPEGAFKRLHENGQVSQEGFFSKGMKHGKSFWYRCADITTEQTIPAECADIIWIATRNFENGQAGPTHFYTKDNIEVLPNGTPVPERPAVVPADAAYSPGNNRWFHGYILHNHAPESFTGNWKWWDHTGRLVEEIHFDETGKKKTTRSLVYRQNNIYREIVKDEFDKLVLEAIFRDDGTTLYRAGMQYNSEGKVVAFHADDFDAALSMTGALTGNLEMHCQYYQNKQLYSEGQFNILDWPTGKWKFILTPGTDAKEFNADDIEWDTIDTRKPGNVKNILARLLVEELAGEPLPEYLKGVDEIKWDQLDGFFETYLSKFPLYFRGLISGDPLLRDFSLAEIMDEFIHQNSLSEVTQKALPFLLKMLEHPNSDKAAILDAIQPVATILASSGTMRAVAEDAGTADLTDETDLDRSMAGVLMNGWPVFKQLLNGNEKRIRKTVLKIVTTIPLQEVDDHLNSIIESLEREERVCVLFQQLSRFQEPPAGPGRFLQHPDPLVRVLAAIDWGIRLKANAPAECLDILIEVFRQKDKALYKDFMELPVANEDMYALISMAIGCLRGEKAFALLPELCNRIADQSPMDAVFYGRGLMTLAFGNGQEPFAPGFTNVMTTLANSEKFRTFNVNANEVLMDWNLPTGREELLTLVESINATDNPEKALRRYMLGE